MLDRSNFSSNLNENRSGNGRQALYQNVTVPRDIDLRIKYELVRLCLDVLGGKHSELKLRGSSQILHWIFKLLSHEDKRYREAAQRFMLLSDRK